MLKNVECEFMVEAVFGVCAVVVDGIKKKARLKDMVLSDSFRVKKECVEEFG